MPCRIVWQTYVEEDTQDYVHYVLRLHFKNGDSFVVDVTAAQQGFEETVMPWEKYERERDALIKEHRNSDTGQAISTIAQRPWRRTLKWLLR